MQLAYIRVLKWVPMGNQPQDGPFLHVLVWCKAYVHPQRHPTPHMSEKGHNLKICNLVRIREAASLHTSVQMVQNWQETPKPAQISWFFCQILAIFRLNTVFAAPGWCVVAPSSLFHCAPLENYRLKCNTIARRTFGTNPQPGQDGLALSCAWFWARGGRVLKKPSNLVIVTPKASIMHVSASGPNIESERAV